MRPRATHKRVRWLTRRIMPGGAVVAFLVTVVVTYPRNDGPIELPPGTGGVQTGVDRPMHLPGRVDITTGPEGW